METKIISRKPKLGFVVVEFSHDGISHTRNVNFCRNASGRFDEAATMARIEEVANGVAHKISLGILK